MKHYCIILILCFFLKTQTKLEKTVVITSSIKRSNNHRFILPVFAAIECTAAAYALIPIIIASLGHINFCLPAQPELTIEE